jgi:hypothetical protein
MDIDGCKIHWMKSSGITLINSTTNYIVPIPAGMSKEEIEKFIEEIMNEQEREKLILTVEQGKELISGDLEGFKTISKTICGQTRWETRYRIVVQRENDGKFFSDTYHVGSTEMQDTYPYDYNEPEFEQVFPKERTITVYE